MKRLLNVLFWSVIAAAFIGPGTVTTATLGASGLAGAAVGGAVGRSMDETDRMKTALALENVRTGVPTAWRNPDTAYEYEVTPTRTFDTAEGPCREFTMQALVGGSTERVHGTACRQPDGSWRIR